MDSILFDNQSINRFERQSLNFIPNESFFPSNQEEGYVTLNEIQFDVDEMDQDGAQDLEEGQIDRSKLSFYKPLYKEMIPTINDTFYKNFYSEAEVIPGSVSAKYNLLGKRLNKFFIQRGELQRGERVNKRIEADYSNPSTYPLCYAIMLYGIDYLSNRDIKKIFKLPKESRNIKRINWSNAALFFESKAQLEQVLKPHIWDKQKHPFFEPKQEQDLTEEVSVPKKLPKGWYGLRPYDHKEELIFWFVRYLTTAEPDHLNEMKQTIEFMEQYNAAKKLFLKKTKEQDDFRASSLNSSRFQTIDRSRKDRSVCLGSEPEKRQRSREKSRGAASQTFGRSGVLLDLQPNDNNQIMLNKHPDLNESYVEPMSFVYTPTNDMRIEAELKKKSDEIIMLMEEMHVGGIDTLESVKSGSVFDMDDDMAIISDNFDPRGLDERFFFDRKNKIAELTTLKPDEKFNYRDYTDKILEAEEEIKQKKAIPVIFID